VRNVKPIKKAPIKFRRSPVKIKGPIGYMRETKAVLYLNPYIPLSTNISMDGTAGRKAVRRSRGRRAVRTSSIFFLFYNEQNYV
jgi:hypothetical protein